MKIVWFCSCVQNPRAQNPGELDAYRFLIALKGTRIDGHATVPVVGEHRRLDNSNLDDAIDWFGEMVASYLQRQSMTSPLYLVPIPDTNITLESSTGPWTSLLTMGIAAKLEADAEALDVLRWKRKWARGSPPPEDVGELYSNLTLIRKPEWLKPVILVGYLTSGASLVQASAACLRANGAEVIHTLYAGRMVSQSPKEPFGVMRADVADIHPDEPP